MLTHIKNFPTGDACDGVHSSIFLCLLWQMLSLCNTRKRKPSVCAARCLAKCVRPRFKATALKKVLKNVCQEEEVKRTVLIQLRSDAKTKACWPNRVPATSASMFALPICALKSALQKTLVASTLSLFLSLAFSFSFSFYLLCHSTFFFSEFISCGQNICMRGRLRDDVRQALNVWKIARRCAVKLISFLSHLDNPSLG